MKRNYKILTLMLSVLTAIFLMTGCGSESGTGGSASAG